MKNKEIILQIFTGGYNHKETNFQKIEEKLVPVLEQMKVHKVIAGWTIDKELYRKLAKLLHNYSVELYLWLPVFSETGELKESKKLRDFNGKEIETFSFQEGENFEFYCPNTNSNVDNVIEIFNEHFSDIDFDGVFLDKIRYGAFSNGLSGVFSCFCPECMAKYKEHGLDTDTLIAEMKKVQEGLGEYENTVLGITKYENGTYEFMNPIWNQFFDLKAQMIYRSLIPLCEYFKSRNLRIGLDTFSPFTAYFAGQNLPLVNGLADFIKPMMYRVTNAPAGLAFEIEQVIRETTSNESAREKLFDVLHCKHNKDEPFDINFVKKELETITAHCSKTYCGIEVNRIEKIAPATPTYIKENLEQLWDLDINGFVLSWNLLSAPWENIETVITYTQKRR